MALSINTPVEGFPSDFAWGAATAAYQIEGGWDMDGRGPSIWDTFCHSKGRVFEDHTGDVACNSYQLWDEDLKCIQLLGLTHYRLSFSWSRLLPDGTTSVVNPKGVAYYDKVIDDLIASAVVPMVTLNHFDLPQALQDRGGWESPEIADVFDSYAQFCFKTFGDRVKLWITLNEPYICAKLGYENGLFAPGLKKPGTSVYIVGHNLLRAHAKAWHSYNAHFRCLQEGRVSIALNSDWAEPLDPCCPEDVAAAQRYMDFNLGWFACPVFGTGDYPESMRSRIEAQNIKLGFTVVQRLPKFSEDEPSPLGTADFFALNYYTSRKVKDTSSCPSELSFIGDQGVEAIIDPSWPVCGVSWLAVMPEGLRKLLKYIKETCNNPAIYITENGFSQIGPVEFEDIERSQFYQDTLQHVSKAITEDGVNVRGYFSWSLLDNFEWSDGFSVRFGLFHVDFSSPELKRTMYRSGKEYAAVIKRYRTYTKPDN
ncbi:cytosolic beta-glucosidase isoform X1 [Tachysurus fulvidraco]|uniref:cytosolic beta-glucosidase isoform X1 n=2 Tax=Tachysurus fulvidraco TaxID=1234273 RepID=UPI001FEEB1B9|nr:cytosolic beta-glucosidase isoform X1 [Tachysurus fulvidraco]